LLFFVFGAHNIVSLIFVLLFFFVPFVLLFLTLGFFVPFVPFVSFVPFVPLFLFPLVRSRLFSPHRLYAYQKAVMGVETPKPCCGNKPVHSEHGEGGLHQSSDAEAPPTPHTPQTRAHRASSLNLAAVLGEDVEVSHHSGGHHGDEHHHSSGNCLIDTLLGEDHTSFDALIRDVSDVITKE
jgi:hypothetical protein